MKWFEAGYRRICDLDADYSGWMGVGESVKKTSVKPGGTIPLLAGEEGGMRIPISPFYMRTVRIDHLSPLVEQLKEAGYRVEKDRTTPRSMVVYFPCKSNSKRFAKDVGIWEQMVLFITLQRHWSDNQVSATIGFKPEEVSDVSRVLDVYRGEIKACSFLPITTHGFVQSPYIECTEQEYNQAMSVIDNSRLGHIVVTTIAHESSSEEKFCTSESCEVR
jgi:hypothetical protein